MRPPSIRTTSPMAQPVYLVSDETRVIVPLGRIRGTTILPYPADVGDAQWLSVILRVMSAPGTFRVATLAEAEKLGLVGYLQLVRDHEFKAFASDPDPGERFESFSAFLVNGGSGGV